MYGKHNFSSNSCENFPFSFRHKKKEGKSHGNIYATEEWKAIEDFFFTVCRLNVLEMYVDFGTKNESAQKLKERYFKRFFHRKDIRKRRSFTLET